MEHYCKSAFLLLVIPAIGLLPGLQCPPTTPPECEDTEEPVIITVDTQGDAEPGATITLAATVVACDGSTVESYEWAQSNSVAVDIDGADTDTATVTFPGADVYKDELITHLLEPPIEEENLPPNVELPEDGFVGGLQDRWQVAGINPFALEETAHVGLTLTVTTTSGVYEVEQEILTDLPWSTQGGINNVPVGIPVLLYGKTQAAYDWSGGRPGGSAATFTDGDTQAPYFTPDEAGLYTITVTDTTGEAPAVVELQVYAGNWAGAISGQDGAGLPTATSCTVCHNDSIAPDKFSEWAATGHAMIATDQLNTGNHWGEGCFPCHTVGYNPDADNGGFDDADDFDAFLASGLINSQQATNWTAMLADYPNAASLANIQCENCHGPNTSAAHTTEEPRISLSSDVCGVCHGEPLRHGRYQQWQLSRHADYGLAVEEGESGSCARCHTVNGFLEWDELGFADTDVEVTWEADEIHPQTCVACHDPHDVGTVSGDANDVTVRVSGDTPELLAGFTATDVGNGALCMTCHNSRRGLRNDDNWDTVGSADAARSPHGPAQSDILMGQNAYFVTVGTRGSHSQANDTLVTDDEGNPVTVLADTCADCHMQQTDPPDELSYNLGGTNHTFFASEDICENCHGSGFTADIVTSGIEADLVTLEGLIADAILDLITDQIAAGNTIEITNSDTDVVTTITDASAIASIAFGETHGRQGIDVTLTDGTSTGMSRLPDVLVIDTADAELGELYDFADDRLPKSGWNYLLVHNDGSHGIHNPSFAGSVLNAAIDEMEALNAE